MLQNLSSKNIGPIEEMDIALAPRLNIFTGDNGLGKTFILDLVWWALTGRWAKQVNPKLTQSYMIKPAPQQKGRIEFSYTADEEGKRIPVKSEAIFSHPQQDWVQEHVIPPYSGIVIYALADGSFALWDVARNTKINGPQTPPAYIFSSQEIWDGLKSSEGKPLCNGLIADWAGWQKENNTAFQHLCNVIHALSPPEESLKVAPLTRIDVYDVRDMPTIQVGNNKPVPVVYASSAIKRVLALAYCLIWALEEHNYACKILDRNSVDSITFLIDEVDAHLHPKWQRIIVSTLKNVLNSMALWLHEPLMKMLFREEETPPPQKYIQVCMVTHSPLILTSLEDIFDNSSDAWFDLDYDAQKNTVHIEKRDFIKQGSASYWCSSEAFGLKTDFSPHKEALYERIRQFTAEEKQERIEALTITQAMEKTLPDIDILWPRWRAYCAEKGIEL